MSLDPQTVTYIRRLASSGYGPKAIGRLLEISPKTAAKYLDVASLTCGCGRSMSHSGECSFRRLIYRGSIRDLGEDDLYELLDEVNAMVAKDGIRFVLKKRDDVNDRLAPSGD